MARRNSGHALYASTGGVESMKLKQTHPELSRLAARVVHERHRPPIEREPAALRKHLTEQLLAGNPPAELMKALLSSEVEQVLGGNTYRIKVANRL